MGVTPRGISYEEIKPPQYKFSRDGISATRTLKIAWDDIERFASEAFPPGVVTSGGNIVPATQVFPGKSYLILNNLDVTPFDEEYPDTNDFNGVATCPSGAIATLSYETQTFKEGEPLGDGENEDGLAIFSHALQIGGEYLQLPASSLRWSKKAADPDDEELNQFEDLQAGKLIPLIEHVVTLYRVPELPLETIISKIGRINIQYDELFQAPAETLLFLGCNASRKVTTDGAEAWELEYRFSQRVMWQYYTDLDGNDLGDPLAVGWNHFMDPKLGFWRKLYIKNGDTIYATTDNFMALFYPGIPEDNSSSSVGV